MTEHITAREWRESLKLSQADLANLSGYSYESIRVFESGEMPTRTWSTKAIRMKRRPIPPKVWFRYKRVCQAIDFEKRGLIPVFDWLAPVDSLEPENRKALNWRHTLKLTQKQLAELTGYGHNTILDYERNATTAFFVWQRYKRVCQAVTAELTTGRTFAW